MPLRILEISAPSTASKTIDDLAKKHEAIDSWHSAKNKDGRRTTRILVHLDQQQGLMDILQTKLFKEKEWRIAVIPVEATLPKLEESKTNENGEKTKITQNLLSGTITREELYMEIEKGAKLDYNFIFLVLLSALVAAIGLIKNDVAVIIGAMVIAPLLGPNLALAFGAALGDRDLMISSSKTNAIGLAITVFIASLIGFTLPGLQSSAELLSRTNVDFASIALALAAGAAGVLSITTGMSGALVGVMVAVALMPPAVTMGIYLGDGSLGLATGAALLLATNIICVSLAANLIFLIRGIKPRTYYMRKKSKQSIKYNLTFWAVMLLGIIGLILLRAA